MKLKFLAAATALAFAGISASANAQVAVGDTVYGPQGNEVGTVEDVQGGNVVLNTGNMTATLPADTFGEGENGPTIGWNKADLEAAITAANQEQEAALDAALTAGTQVYSTDGIVVGSINEVDPTGMVVVEHTEAGPIQLPKDQFALQNNQLTFLATAAQLSQAVSAQAGPTAAAPADATAAADATGETAAGQ